MYKKLKSYLSNDAIFMAGLLLCVGISSFGLGRLSIGSSVLDQERVSQVALISSSLPVISQSTTTASTSSVVQNPVFLVPEPARYVGSKSGTKYHLETCSGAKRIKPENKIYFKTTNDAEAAGYSKAANCPGL